MDILALKRLGLSKRHIARRLCIDPRTVQRYLSDPSVIGHRKRAERQSMLDPYKAQIESWINEDDGVTARWILCRLASLGYSGGYERVKLFVRSLKRERSRVAFERFETMPAQQAQVDFAEFVVDRSDGTQRKYFLFVMVLGYSRMLYAELLERCDLVSFLDAHIRAFEFFGGVPLEMLYDRMKNVYIRRVAGKHVFSEALVSLAMHYGFTPHVAPAYAPWVKGKVERPIQFVRESFWRCYGFVSLERTNLDVLAWSRQSAQRVHGTTQEQVCMRFEKEKPLLSPLPATTFDTSYRIFRKVHKDCTICFDGNRYVAPHELVGAAVVLRVKNGMIRLFSDENLIAEYTAADGRGHICDPHGFYNRLRHDREMNKRKYANGKRLKGRARYTISPSVPSYAAMAVEHRRMDTYSLIGGEVTYE